MANFQVPSYITWVNVTVTVTPPPTPNFCDDFMGTRHGDIVRNGHGISNQNRYNFFQIEKGVLTNYYPIDSFLMHEIGHLITRPIEKWWRFDTPNIDFAFQRPITAKGVLQLIENEIAAAVIEKALTDYYDIFNTQGDLFPLSLHHFCTQQFPGITPTLKWIEDRYAEKVTIETVFERWDKLIQQLRVLCCNASYSKS